MSILLIFCVLAAAGWLLLSLVTRDRSDRPDASVAAHARAMAALNVGDTHPARTAARAPRPRTRATRPRSAGTPARRRPGTAARPSAHR